MFSGALASIRNRKEESASQESHMTSQDPNEVSLENNHSDESVKLTTPAKKTVVNRGLVQSPLVTSTPLRLGMATPDSTLLARSPSKLSKKHSARFRKTNSGSKSARIGSPFAQKRKKLKRQDRVGGVQEKMSKEDYRELIRSSMDVQDEQQNAVPNFTVIDLTDEDDKLVSIAERLEPNPSEKVQTYVPLTYVTSICHITPRDINVMSHNYILTGDFSQLKILKAKEELNDPEDPVMNAKQKSSEREAEEQMAELERELERMRIKREARERERCKNRLKEEETISKKYFPKGPKLPPIPTIDGDMAAIVDNAWASGANTLLAESKRGECRRNDLRTLIGKYS